MKKIILCGFALSIIISASAQKKCKTVKQTKSVYCKKDIPPPPPPLPPPPPPPLLPPPLPPETPVLILPPIKSQKSLQNK